MRTQTHFAPFLILAVLACGGDDDAAFETDAGPAAEAGTTPDSVPGLPSETTEFRPSGEAASGLTGTLWIATSQQGGPDGISLIANLENVPRDQAYSWALHQGDCAAPDQPVLPLGYGTEATGDEERSGQGGPLGETRAAFQPTVSGTAEETVWIPFNGVVDRETFEAGTFSLRIHPSAGTEEIRPSVACAPVPVVREG